LLKGIDHYKWYRQLVVNWYYWFEVVFIIQIYYYYEFVVIMVDFKPFIKVRFVIHNTVLAWYDLIIVVFIKWDDCIIVFIRYIIYDYVVIVIIGSFVIANVIVNVIAIDWCYYFVLFTFCSYHYGLFVIVFNLIVDCQYCYCYLWSFIYSYSYSSYYSLCYCYCYYFYLIYYI